MCISRRYKSGLNFLLYTVKLKELSQQLRIQAQSIIEEGSSVRSIYDGNGVSIGGQTSQGSGTMRSFASPYATN